MSATIIFWRDIPAQIVIGKGRRAEKIQLADRFMVAVDKAAMVGGATSADEYLEDWHRQPAPTNDDGGAWSAESLARHIEAQYPTSRLAALARAGGKEPK